MRKAYLNGYVLDGTENMEPREGLVIITDCDRIVRIAPKDEISNEELRDCEIVNLAGGYVMPGLINLHVHIPGSGKISKETSDTKKVVKLMMSNPVTRAYGHKMYNKYALQALLSGVTTERSVGGIRTYDTALRDRINAGKVLGPRILASNMAVSVPDGHMAGSLAYEATSADEAAYYVRVIAEDNPDWIKLMITGGVLDAEEVGSPGIVKMPLEYVTAACEQAHKLGLPVAAHVESLEGVKIALKGGVDTIEHGATLDEEAIELFKIHGASHVETILPAQYFTEVDREFTAASDKDVANGEIVMEGIINCAKTCLAEGIPVGLGTDAGCPFSPQYAFWRELVCMVKYVGVTPKEALHYATLGNARIVGISDITGSIEEGKCADMIVTEENPIENLNTLGKLKMVIARGDLIKNPKIKKYEDIERILDDILVI